LDVLHGHSNGEGWFEWEWGMLWGGKELAGRLVSGYGCGNLWKTSKRACGEIEEHRLKSVLQAGIDRFGFEGQDTEDAFVDTAEGFVAHEAFEGFDAQGEFAQS